MAVGAGVVSVVDAPATGQQGFILAVGHDGLVQFFGKEHGLPHHLPGLDAPAVIGESGNIRRHGGKVRQGLPLFAAGDGAVRIDVDPGTAGNGAQLRLEGLPALRHGLEVGHGAHGSVAAGGRRRGAGCNGLFIRKTRLPKMNMDINETWNNETVL